ncbi:hypothetical protein PGTUg99_026116 [Puccinia graminis f. sp. tritici]|uniref:Uncharacterized protein n=1 Tax=Puccinia graminis f. sp. tritici TaxID=56615 RepID=A0A5B0R7V0_PUCGR|nr:hypothetical protein PGTUg99_026116 [Puccinia graminis f. sp. tritici]
MDYLDFEPSLIARSLLLLFVVPSAHTAFYETSNFVYLKHTRPDFPPFITYRALNNRQ